jgi:hypothetical protein
MAKYKSYTLKNITEFVRFIGDHCGANDTLFRGQAEDKPLLPTLARLNFTSHILTAEKKMFREFKRRSLPLLGVQPKSSWDWLAIAQHHGMATRLLDWTLNPLAALWFAVKDPPVKKKSKDCPGVVWILTPKPSDHADTSNITSPFKLPFTKIFRPRHIAIRLVNQAGWFTVHMFMKTKNRFIPLENNIRYSTKLTKLCIPPDAFADMRFELDRFSVNASTLFPGIDGLCSHIQTTNTLLEDEG